MPYDHPDASRVSAAEHAQALVAAARDDPTARLALLRRLYEVPRGVDRGYLPYRRAASAFMGWQLRRGLLNAPDDPCPGSPWWRAVNEILLRDTAEARAFAFGCGGKPSSPAVDVHLQFIQYPTARNWYRAHNASIAAAFMANEELAYRETRVERFFLNVVLIRVLYAHALVAAPQLALGWLAPMARPLGDPRVGMTGIFLSLSRILPDRYPLGDDVETYVALEHRLGHLLDVGIIRPRWGRLYEWSADELAHPALRELFNGDTPTYAWATEDSDVWQFQPSLLARAARRFVPA
ncbi:hypothetical protein [Mycobacterium sherrisii]|uniref:Uncharacterized protein n=1 Tax=Mycobacterium sherrisii TaxID=243061 RepID=A0A1E3T283_9MYCO|nr:hypothetical protein [Mycobacterium sherrisii]MCV7028198.1 hypothetical protein [Mycobacterium sherrisii]ODR07908.1 hypothetical protein BHQ21_07480 [Mycobacterium sherrisii]ORW77808.1 hypothetical protein AWC25_07390 [Mycobacterium sherrisii]